MKIGKEFKPAPQLKSLYHVYIFLFFLIVFLPWQIPLLLFGSTIVIFIITIALTIPILFILAFAAWWVPKFYDTIFYKLTESEIIWRRGVWFKGTGIVPYNRITNVDITQGPISRKFGVASLKIQTAGYSAPSSGRAAEIKLEGIEKFEELREVIMGFVRGRKPVAVETYDEDNRVVSELVKIRKLLGKK